MALINHLNKWYLQEWAQRYPDNALPSDVAILVIEEVRDACGTIVGRHLNARIRPNMENSLRGEIYHAVVNVLNKYHLQSDISDWRIEIMTRDFDRSLDVRVVPPRWMITGK